MIGFFYSGVDIDGLRWFEESSVECLLGLEGSRVGGRDLWALALDDWFF